MNETLFVGATPGLELALAEELDALGFAGEPSSGGVTLEAPAGSYRFINLWSRLASRVLLRVGEVSSVEALRRLPLGGFARDFEIDAFGEQAERWGNALPSKQGGVKLLLRGVKGRCQVSVDTSGELLHFRGYRQEVGRAPMRETLAAGLLQLAKWQPGEPLWDVMCGSGTILIEAAERAAGLAPGRNRPFAFESFASHDDAAWRALPRARAAVPTELLGSDLNAGALGVARRNAKRAGVFEALRLERLDATKLTRRGERGLVVANLPYGKRVGERDALGRLYAELGASLRRACSGWYFAFLLQHGAEHLGLEIAERHAVSNGGLDCEVVLGQLD
ncbi:MAG: THUMP domain-containing class I SAM-dependent RNA methyltransferase [Myxococcota bacterium]